MSEFSESPVCIEDDAKANPDKYLDPAVSRICRRPDGIARRCGHLLIDDPATSDPMLRRPCIEAIGGSKTTEVLDTGPYL